MVVLLLLLRVRGAATAATAATTASCGDGRIRRDNPYVYALDGHMNDTMNSKCSY